MFCFFKHAVLPDIVRKKEKHFVTFNRKENKIIDSSWSLMLVITKTCAILGKYLNMNLPVQGNGCMEITTASFPKGSKEIVHRAINCTALSPLLLTLQFLHFYISTSLVTFGFGILPCLCSSACVQKVPCWPALPQPAISTYKIHSAQFGIATPSLTRRLIDSRTSALASGCYRAETFEREIRTG